MKRKLLLLLLSLLLIGSLVACDSQAPSPSVPQINDDNSGGATPPAEENNPSSDDDNTPPIDYNEGWLNVSTYNIVHCADQQDPDKAIHPDNIVNYIDEHDIDIIGLNEVDVNCQRSMGWLKDEYYTKYGSHQPKYIAEKLTEKTGEQYYWAFAASLDGCLKAAHSKLGNGQYGNAIISKYPILSTRTILVATHTIDPNDPSTQMDVASSRERRSLLFAEIDVEGTVITVISTHFGLLQDERALAIQRLESELAVIETPVIFMGDLNCYYDSNEIKHLNTLLKPTATGSTPPSFVSSGKRIDYIFTSVDIKTKDLQAPFVRYSDHYPVLVKVKLGEPTA